MKMVQYYVLIIGLCISGCMRAEISQTGSSYEKRSADQEGELYEYGSIREVVVTPDGIDASQDQNANSPLVVQKEGVQPNIVEQEVGLQKPVEPEVAPQNIAAQNVDSRDTNSHDISVNEQIVAISVPMAGQDEVATMVPQESLVLDRENIVEKNVPMQTIIEKPIINAQSKPVEQMPAKSISEQGVIEASPAVLAPVVQEPVDLGMIKKSETSTVEQESPVMPVDSTVEADQAIIRDMEQIK